MNRIPQILGFETKNVIINNILSKLKEELLAFFYKLFFRFFQKQIHNFHVEFTEIFFWRN